MKRRTYAFSTTAAAVTAALTLSLSAPGCGLLTEALALLGIDLLGVTPAADFNRTGNVEFSLLPRSEGGGISLGSFSSSSLDVAVENDDGSASECDFVGDDVTEGSPFNSIALVIDDSGSMGNFYPEEEYGDLCLTCPHDPDNIRADAAAALIQHVHGEAPYSRIAVMDFGPDADPGMSATRILVDFTDRSDSLLDGLNQVDGTQMVGTPMWDSLAEVILATEDDAEDFQDLLRSGAITTNDTSTDTSGNGTIVTPGGTATDIGDQTTGNTVVDPTTAEVKRVIVVISDGDDRDSVQYTLESLIALANDNNVVIHAIGLGPASAAADDPRLLAQGQTQAVQNLQRLAEATGGYYASARDADALVALYTGVANSMTEGYATTTFSCQPAEAGPGGAVGALGQRRIPSSGERVNGTISISDGVAIPWTFVAP